MRPRKAVQGIQPGCGSCQAFTASPCPLYREVGSRAGGRVVCRCRHGLEPSPWGPLPPRVDLMLLLLLPLLLQAVMLRPLLRDCCPCTSSPSGAQGGSEMQDEIKGRVT